MEGELRKLLQLVKEAGGTASLTFFVKGGKTKAKLEVDLDSEPAPTSSSTPSAPAPRSRRRRRRRARGAPQPEAPPGHQGLHHLLTEVKLEDLLDLPLCYL